MKVEMFAFVLAFAATLFVGDAASTFLYHVPQHLWGRLHLRIHHDNRRSFWDHAVLSRDPSVLLDGLLGAVPYMVVTWILSHFGLSATAGAITALILGQMHVWWRHTTEIGWRTSMTIRGITRPFGLVLPEDHQVHHADPEAGFGDLFLCFDRPARNLIAWARSRKGFTGRREDPTAPRIGIAVVLAAIHIGALAAFLPAFFSWSGLWIALGLYYVTGSWGICLGYHRLLSHRSYRVPKVVEYFLATCGALALQGDPIEWISTHRAHHVHSDTDRDPHNARRGFFWSHLGWMVGRNEARLSASDMRRYATGLIDDPYYRFLRYATPFLTIGLVCVLYAFGGISWVIWGVCVRLVATYHITWAINSLAHAVGYQSYDASDLSTNNWFVGILTWGEGWHNNHHAFPSSARHGLAWNELDVNWLTLKLLAFLGVVKSMHIVSVRSRIRRSTSIENPLLFVSKR